MKLSAVVSDLQRILNSQGNIDIVFQDSPPNEHPECCKHEHFFIIEEPKDGPPEYGMEVVLRTWPY
jgi:hypothetical protein